ncbi:hypothetical protein MASR1M66_21830 [Aminivibrio sp.]
MHKKTVLKKVVQIEPEDNVAVAVQDITAGERVDCSGWEILARNDVPKGHKIALLDIPLGKRIIKYAVAIGKSSQDIFSGDHVHSHNIEDITNQLCNEYERQFRSVKG